MKLLLPLIRRSAPSQPDEWYSVYKELTEALSTRALAPMPLHQVRDGDYVVVNHKLYVFKTRVPSLICVCDGGPEVVPPNPSYPNTVRKLRFIRFFDAATRISHALNEKGHSTRFVNLIATGDDQVTLFDEDYLATITSRCSSAAVLVVFMKNEKALSARLRSLPTTFIVSGHCMDAKEQEEITSWHVRSGATLMQCSGLGEVTNRLLSLLS